MTKVRSGGEPVRKFLISKIGAHPNDIVRVTAEKFGCSRQAVHKHIQKLVEEGAVVVSGTTRNKRYELAPLSKWSKRYDLASVKGEDVVWREDVLPQIGKLPENVLNIWHYGFTEMFNNVIDHSDALHVIVLVERTAASTTIEIADDGIGIFKKIQLALELVDERHAVLELAKGKFTTDPANHSGEGIFFSSRMFDDFEIFSGEVYFSHQFDKKEDWILQRSQPRGGTHVFMKLHNHTSRTMKKVFDKFTSAEDYGFTKTVVPVRLMRYGDDNLISRSQAKRLLARFDRFKVVMLDFSGVTMIGQAFADEVFRVFKSKHPDVDLIPMHASQEVLRMISRAELLGSQGDA